MYGESLSNSSSCLASVRLTTITSNSLSPNGLLNGVIFIYFKKAYDTIYYEIVLRKLENCGIDELNLMIRLISKQQE